MANLSRLEISRIPGLRSVGQNVLISDKCSIYATDLVIGDNVRIDDFCILSGKITLGNNIHIGAYSALYGKHGIIMQDFTGLSPRCTIFSASDDFSGNFLISPMTPDEYTHVTGGVVTLKQFVQIGAGTIIMPCVTIGTGSAVGAMSFVKHDVRRWEIVAGNPLKFIKYRHERLLKLAKQYKSEL
jgi:acetyltransferase-like isoleucine patch superfamily enzyme